MLPPITGVDPEPKLQGPPAVTRDWYSLRHTLKYVSHSSRVHFRSPGFRAPPQQFPFCSSPFTFCMDRISNSNWPEAPHTLARRAQSRASRRLRGRPGRPRVRGDRIAAQRAAGTRDAAAAAAAAVRAGVPAGAAAGAAVAAAPAAAASRL